MCGNKGWRFEASRLQLVGEQAQGAKLKAQRTERKQPCLQVPQQMIWVSD
jgi:hypothetical protein